MTPLYAALTPAAAAHIHAKLPHVRRDDRQLFLDRFRDACFVDRAAAMRTRVGQRHLNRLVDVPGRLAMPMAAVAPPGPPAGRLSTERRRAPRERRRLASARAARGFEFLLQPIILSPKPLHLAPQSVVLATRLVVNWRSVRLARLVGALHAPRCARVTGSGLLSRNPLANHAISTRGTR